MTPPTASPVSHLPLFKDLGKLVRPEVFSFTKPGSLRAEVSGPRSDPSDPLFPSHPFPLCLWGRPSQVH
jgi:hypothetical protein